MPQSATVTYIGSTDFRVLIGCTQGPLGFTNNRRLFQVDSEPSCAHYLHREVGSLASVDVDVSGRPIAAEVRFYALFFGIILLLVKCF